ncbi:tail fiber domain-containing protein [Pontiella sp.]|uniref:tail fiber domain-containing protein n=1 Tax=Pontiella sp. TaxID=2837462 RepID=UPI0035665622
MYKQVVAMGIMWVAGAGFVIADQQILDDLIVDGSLAVGQDAVNGEDFGFDTIRLKENNLRIHFSDTSTSGSFPSTDWRIVINDSSNGGDNYFAIEDADAGRLVFRVDAGAPANALKVDGEGDVGIGLENPVLELHVAGGDTPGLRLEQDGTEGWTPQAWDLAGNEDNFFIRDVTHASAIPFRIQPGAPDNALTVKASGKTGIGTWNPQAKLHVEASVNEVGALLVGPATVVPTTTLHVEGNAYIGGTLEIASRRALKENIGSVSSDEAMAAFKALEPVRFNYIGEDESQLGFIAEDVPELVATKNRRSVSPMDFSALLTRVVQDQQQTIDRQQATIDTLSQRLEALEKRLEQGE